MSRIRRGWELTGKSWGVLRAHRGLLAFPLYGGVLTVIVVAALGLPGVLLIDVHEYVPGVVLLAVGLYLVVFTGVWFGVALAATADDAFHGREVSLGSGMRVARSRAGPIAAWSAVSALIGAALAALESSGRGAEVLVGSVLDAAWSLITFLAVPVIAFEGVGPFAAIKRSASLFRSRWPGQITGNLAIGGIVGLVGILPAIGLVALGVVLWISDGNGEEIAAGAVLVVIGVALFALSSFVISAMRGIFGVALYRFADSGETGGGFTPDELNSAVRTTSGR